MTVEQFKEKVNQLKSSTANSPTTFVVSIRLPLEWKNQWDELLTASDQSASELMMELIRSYVEAHAESQESTAPAPASAATSATPKNPKRVNRNIPLAHAS